jgi:hypothetical protein
MLTVMYVYSGLDGFTSIRLPDLTTPALQITAVAFQVITDVARKSYMSTARFTSLTTKLITRM